MAGVGSAVGYFALNLHFNPQIEEGKAAWAAIKAGFFSGRAGLLEGFKGALRGGFSNNAASAGFEDGGRVGGGGSTSRQEVELQAQISSVKATPPALVQVSIVFAVEQC